MQEILMRKLYVFTRDNNPELLWQLQQENAVTEWLRQKVYSITEMLDIMLEKNKPAYIIEQECMDLLTGDLRPSRFHYILELMEQEFPLHFELALANESIKETVVGLAGHCETIFEECSFSADNVDDPLLRYHITGLLEQHLNRF